MDTHNCAKIMEIGQFRRLMGGKTVAGVKQIRKAVEKGAVRVVFLAEDADPALTLPLEAACGKAGIPCCRVRSMAELGRACGIEVRTAAAAIMDSENSTGEHPVEDRSTAR